MSQTLPPQNFRFSLPALSPDEAEQLLHFIDAIRELLWDAYAADVFDDFVGDQQTDPADPTPDDVDF